MVLPAVCEPHQAHGSATRSWPSFRFGRAKPRPHVETVVLMPASPRFAPSRLNHVPCPSRLP